MKNREILTDLRERHVAHGEELEAEVYPELYNVSGGMFFKYLPYPKERRTPEYVYVDVPDGSHERREAHAEVLVYLAQWNMAWESGHLRNDIFELKQPPGLQWLQEYKGCNFYLLPRTKTMYEAYKPLFHLLPRRLLEQYRLPLLKKGIWPLGISWGDLDRRLPEDFDERLSIAFAHHIWPFLNRQSGISAFSKTEPIQLLAHNLDFWAPYVYKVAENRLSQFDRVRYEDDKQRKELRHIQRQLDSNVSADRPRMGGCIWIGEEDAREATCETIEIADSEGNLRAIMDAIKSHRVEDDFSAVWSRAKEDFERKLYKKRSKIKVTFVEIDDTIPVHGPNSEVHENLLWEDFMALLNRKERHIIVLLRSGFTKVGEISQILGYANHSPVSKALASIRRKARAFLET